MFVVELIYKADLEEIDARMRAHMAFLKSNNSMHPVLAGATHALRPRNTMA